MAVPFQRRKYQGYLTPTAHKANVPDANPALDIIAPAQLRSSGLLPSLAAALPRLLKPVEQAPGIVARERL